ncbi:MAG: glycosyltransferase [Chitinophagales bacterium]
MKLSIIIVSYNVAYFLEQALLSVRAAIEGKSWEAEVFVVDNHSKDNSVELVRNQFPEVHLIANQKNTGFSMANNQAIRLAKGEYILLLNPDTVVAEDTFEQVIEFMDAHADAGGLGVKMIDGKGEFLPESKRGLPSPSVAFCKMFGLSKLFSKSQTFNWYYLGHLDPTETQEVEVLAGAFMLMRKTVLDEVGLLDETFFMYGEDIDLSWRILQAGYKNYFFPYTQIIHYKGESTKKGSLNYVRVFYNAMIIFAQKHFKSQKAWLYIAGIKVAIYLHAALTLLQNFLGRAIVPIADAVVMYGGMYWVKYFWQTRIHLNPYPLEYMLVNVPIYIVIWLAAIFFSGGYDKPTQPSKIVRGVLVGSVLIAALYGFLPEEMRFSRGMILLGTAWAAFTTVGWRLAVHFLRKGDFRLGETVEKRAVIVGDFEEAKRVKAILQQVGAAIEVMGYVGIEGKRRGDEAQIEEKLPFLSSIDALKEMVQIYGIEEIIFCSKSISAKQIMLWMVDFGQEKDFKIVPSNSNSIIGSNSKNTAGDLYTVDASLLMHQNRYRRNKRMLDILLCIIVLVGFPVFLFLVENRKGLWINWWRVLINRLSWVAYAPVLVHKSQKRLPKIKNGVLNPTDLLPAYSYNEATRNRLNWLYARDYHTSMDWKIFWKGIRKLGN